MSTTSVIPAARPSNVYYLAPSPTEPARAPKLSWQLVLRLRLLSFYWRCKLTAAETVSVLRRFGRPEAAPADSTFLEQRAEMILAAPPRALGPARVIDLDAARLRLRG